VDEGRRIAGPLNPIAKQLEWFIPLELGMRFGYSRVECLHLDLLDEALSLSRAARRQPHEATMRLWSGLGSGSEYGPNCANFALRHTADRVAVGSASYYSGGVTVSGVAGHSGSKDVFEMTHQHLPKVGRIWWLISLDASPRWL
jgi:hypothetical protein